MPSRPLFLVSRIWVIPLPSDIWRTMPTPGTSCRKHSSRCTGVSIHSRVTDEHYDLEELTDVLDVEPGTVKSRLNRAKQKIKEIY